MSVSMFLFFLTLPGIILEDINHSYACDSGKEHGEMAVTSSELAPSVSSRPLKAELLTDVSIIPDVAIIPDR